ncbi:lysophospholipid acyltransferase family protein [Nannocystis pusilla]|uniref:1-acyl-sn-glycerol-3-phosphate acyltransferase n=1 Tax=Nannocystis pusilla TaxID=889268 RepID=A0ABS7TXY1_9BACT|nr:1-acyl-sn-glycerol-3-phosphate acyltransferase [Nannocystis pusilla]
MQRLRSALFWSYLAASLVVFWIAVAPIWVLVAPFDPRRRFSHWYAITWANHCIRLFGASRIHIRGRERLLGDRPCVLVANHQSFGDIFVLYALRTPFKWVAKESVFWVPFLGWMMAMADYVPVRRGDPHSRARMLARCRQHLRDGSRLLLFPEGTRSRDGQIREFRRGAFALAVEAGVPIVPIVIDGTGAALPRDGWVFEDLDDLRVDVHVLEPVDPDATGGDVELLQTHVRELMIAALHDIRGPRAVRPRA